jgi:DNA adenine methylase
MPIYSLFRYPGGKSRAVKVLETFLPDCIKIMYSPFFGGGSFELYCANEKNIKIIGNDLDADVYNVYKQIKENKEAVIQCIKQNMHLYPKNREDFFKLKGVIQTCKSKIKRAALFLFINKASFSGKGDGFSTTVRKIQLQKIKDCNLDNLTSINNLDFEVFLRSFKVSKTSIIFLDPPYITSQYYYGEKGEFHKHFEHERLSKLLHTKFKNHLWFLCYNDCEQVRNMYNDCHIQNVSWVHSLSTTQSNYNKEIVILSDNLHKLIFVK